MTLVRRGAFTALALVSVLAAQQASAQSLRGFRVEAQTGYDQFNADGDHHSKWGVGGAAGVDFDLGGFVLGPEVTYWWAPNEVRTVDGPGLAEHKSFEEWAVALRAGVNVTPATLIYGKVGYVWNDQRKRFTPFNSAGVLDSALPGAYYDHHSVHGWQWGAGVNQMISGGFYASLEGRYSDYQSKGHSGGTHRIVGLVGLGYLFGASAPVAPPPPPPPPPPPAPVERGERG